MSLRARLTLAAAVAVAVAVMIVAAVSYLTVERKLVDETDHTLATESEPLLDPGFLSRVIRSPLPADLRDSRTVQVILQNGRVLRRPGESVRLPVDHKDREVAEGENEMRFRTTSAGGAHVRVITRSVGNGVALQFSRPLAEVDNTLSSLRLILILVAGLGVALATAIGFVVSRAALRPVGRLTEAAEHVAETLDLDSSIEVKSRDEVGRLATSFNAMLAALDGSRQQQRQLVADASHELRTPLTSLRTNIEVLAHQHNMAPDDREQLLNDVVTQLEELSVLVGDLVELAREDGMPQQEEPIEIRFDELVQKAVDRARLRALGITIVVTDCEPTVVDGQQALLERAVVNVLDNACKWSPPDGEVEVELKAGTLTVRDHGPGIDPSDLPYVFDRFYRAPSARSMPGSGLGLAIVRHAAEVHGGTVTAELAPGGGTRIRLLLPSAETVDPVPLVELQD